MHCRGIEPRSPAWQARILPLNQQCLGRALIREGVAHPKYVEYKNINTIELRVHESNTFDDEYDIFKRLNEITDSVGAMQCILTKQKMLLIK